MAKGSANSNSTAKPNASNGAPTRLQTDEIESEESVAVYGLAPAEWSARLTMRADGKMLYPATAQDGRRGSPNSRLSGSRASERADLRRATAGPSHPRRFLSGSTF